MPSAALRACLADDEANCWPFLAAPEHGRRPADRWPSRLAQPGFLGAGRCLPLEPPATAAPDRQALEQVVPGHVRGGRCPSKITGPPGRGLHGARLSASSRHMAEVALSAQATRSSQDDLEGGRCPRRGRWASFVDRLAGPATANPRAAELSSLRDQVGVGLAALQGDAHGHPGRWLLARQAVGAARWSASRGRDVHAETPRPLPHQAAVEQLGAASLADAVRPRTKNSWKLVPRSSRMRGERSAGAFLAERVQVPGRRRRGKRSPRAFSLPRPGACSTLRPNSRLALDGHPRRACGQVVGGRRS